MVDPVSDYLAEKLSEYRIMASPLERAAAEMDYAQRLVKAKVESEIAEHVPALGALADILEISIMDLLMAPDRKVYLQTAMTEAGLTNDDVMLQLRALAPPSGDELVALGFEK